MKIDVRGVDVGVSELLRDKVVRRVLLTLSRFGPRVRSVTVCLAEPANPLGGFDQCCHMRARLQERDDIHVEAINGGFEAAVARAATQLAKCMDFTLHEGTGDGGGAPRGARGGPGRRTAKTAAAAPRRRARPRSG